MHVILVILTNFINFLTKIIIFLTMIVVKKKSKCYNDIEIKMKTNPSGK
ncbi:hypothetical protein SSUA7_1087 [Streptococcus suis A7]|nr:hypothetical protein SSUJS14_1204 [Streptococcus suis JS14]AER44409.1 hypothetical protein SSUA7_1087 [Streptococcus suis A7]AGZ22827.1 hypothetical protein T15_0724 [Streptococcus suis T15]